MPQMSEGSTDPRIPTLETLHGFTKEEVKTSQTQSMFSWNASFFISPSIATTFFPHM